MRNELVPSGHTPPDTVLTPLLELLAACVDHAAHHEARRREPERVEVALRATGIAILLIDDDGRLTWSNQAAVALSGSAHDGTRDQTLAVFLPPSGLDLRAEAVARRCSNTDATRSDNAPCWSRPCRTSCGPR